MASAFAQGMESGTRMAKSWLDTYNIIEEQTRKRRAAEEISAAGSTGLADIPEQPRVYTPDMQVQPAPTGLGTGAYGTQDDFTSIQPQQGLVAPRAAPATPPGTGYARGFTPEQAGAVRTAYAAGGAPAVARTAAEQGMSAQGLTRELPMSQQLKRQADVYAKYGLTDQAEQYRLKAYDVSRQEEVDARTRADYDTKQNTNKAAQYIAEKQKEGRPLDMVLIAEAQAQFNGDYTTLLNTASNVLGITDKVAAAETKKLVNSINKAASQGEGAFNTLLASFADPNKEDNIIPTFTKVRGGYQVMYGDKPMSPLFADAAGVSALQQAASFYTSNAQDKPFETAIQIASLKAKEAQIDASKAQASKDRAQANRYSRDDEEKGLSKKVKDVETSLGRKLTEPEKLTLFGLTAKPRDEKPTKVEEAGVQYKVDGKLVQTDGMGGFISTKGILPENRPAALKAAGVSDNNLSRLIWSNDGEAVMFNNEEYDVKDKRDMAKLNKALAAYDTLNRSIAEEARLRSNPTGPSGFQGARTTGLGPASTYGVAPGAPSIYGR